MPQGKEQMEVKSMAVFLIEKYFGAEGWGIYCG